MPLVASYTHIIDDSKNSHLTHYNEKSEEVNDKRADKYVGHKATCFDKPSQSAREANKSEMSEIIFQVFINFESSNEALSNGTQSKNIMKEAEDFKMSEIVSENIIDCKSSNEILSNGTQSKKNISEANSEELNIIISSFNIDYQEHIESHIVNPIQSENNSHNSTSNTGFRSTGVYQLNEFS
jgi:hypothetical protein